MGPKASRNGRFTVGSKNGRLCAPRPLSQHQRTKLNAHQQGTLENVPWGTRWTSLTLSLLPAPPIGHMCVHCGLRVVSTNLYGAIIIAMPPPAGPKSGPAIRRGLDVRDILDAVRGGWKCRRYSWHGYQHKRGNTSVSAFRLHGHKLTRELSGFPLRQWFVQPGDRRHTGAAAGVNEINKADYSVQWHAPSNRLRVRPGRRRCNAAGSGADPIWLTGLTAHPARARLRAVPSRVWKRCYRTAPTLIAWREKTTRCRCARRVKKKKLGRHALASPVLRPRCNTEGAGGLGPNPRKTTSTPHGLARHARAAVDAGAHPARWLRQRQQLGRD